MSRISRANYRNHFAALGLRCGQPGQQQGRRSPSDRSLSVLSIRLNRVSGFFAEVTQQIHSLRAKGVRSAQRDFIFGSESMAVRKSAGMVCSGPRLSFLFVSAMIPAFSREKAFIIQVPGLDDLSFLVEVEGVEPSSKRVTEKALHV